MKKYLCIAVLVSTVLVGCQKLEITSFSPLEARHGDTVTITGKNLSAKAAKSVVKFNGYDAVVTLASATEIQATVPKNLQSGGKISVTVGEVTVVSVADFTYIPTINVSTLAGSGEAGSANGAGAAAQFDSPVSVAVDVSGNVYVADLNNNCIRKITSDGVVTTLAGRRVFGFADGTGAAALFFYPQDVAADTSNNIYVADYMNSRIRKITSTGVVTTLTDGTGAAARFNNPVGVAVDASGNVYVSDAGNYRIRKITSAGMVTTVAGSGEKGFADGAGVAAQFDIPHDVAVDASGNVYVAETNKNYIRKITSEGMVTTFAGSGAWGFADGTGVSAQFNGIGGIAVDALGNVYVADVLNCRIRKITPDGMVTTVAGSGVPGFADDIGLAAQFNRPTGIVVDASGNVYVADTYNHCIRKMVSE